MFGQVRGMPRLLLRLEALLALGIAVGCYARLGKSWWVFVGLFLVPDVTMVGYSAGKKVGAALYNVGHWYGLPLGCIGWCVWTHHPLGVGVGWIWVAHIGFDRALGYGLKYAQGFRVTHLGAEDLADRAKAA